MMSIPRQSALLVFCSLLLPSLACGHNLATDEGIVEAVNDILGREMDPQYACIDRPEAYPNVIHAGSFAADLGCVTAGLFIDGEWIADLDAAAGMVLADKGWAEATTQQREAWALEWINVVLYQFLGTVLTNPTDDFARPDTPDFSTPTTTSDDDGGVRVMFWARDPGGMHPETSYRRVEITFGSDGAVVQTVRHESFTVEMEF